MFILYGMIAIVIGVILMIIGLVRAKKLNIKKSKVGIAGGTIMILGILYNVGLVIRFFTLLARF